MPLRHFEAAVDIFLSTWIVAHLELQTLQQAVQCHVYVCLYKVALHFGLDNNRKWFHKIDYEDSFLCKDKSTLWVKSRHHQYN